MEGEGVEWSGCSELRTEKKEEKKRVESGERDNRQRRRHEAVEEAKAIGLEGNCRLGNTWR